MEQYLDTKKYQSAYEKASDKEAFLQKYESPLIIQDAAKRLLQTEGISTKSLTDEVLSNARNDYQILEINKIDCKDKLEKINADKTELERLKSSLNSSEPDISRDNPNKDRVRNIGKNNRGDS